MSEPIKLPIIKPPTRNPSTRKISSSKPLQGSLSRQSFRQIYGPKFHQSKSSTLKKTITQNQFPPEKQKMNSQNVYKKSKTIPTKNSQAEILHYEIQKAESDLLELKRDLATYDCNLSIHTNLNTNIYRLLASIVDIPQLLGKISDVNQEDQTFRHQIITTMQTLNQPVCKSQSNEYSLPILKSQAIYYIDNLYKGITNISGICCLASIRATQRRENMSISIITPEGQSFKLVKSRSYRMQSPKSILKKLYFTYSGSKMLKLKYSEQNQDQFLSLLLKIRGCGKCAAILSQQSKSVRILVKPHNKRIEIKKHFLTNKQINYEGWRVLRRQLQKNLILNDQTQELQWIKGSSCFHRKEISSVFMLNTWVASETNEFRFYASFDYKLEGQKYVIELCQQNYNECIKIHRRDQTMVILQGSRSFSSLTELQSLDLATCARTLGASLEFKRLILSVFKKQHCSTGKLYDKFQNY